MQIAGKVWLGSQEHHAGQLVLAAEDPEPTQESILETRVALLAVPMWAATVSAVSPWAFFQPSFLSEAAVADLLTASEDLANLNWCWYANQTVVIFLREIDRLPEGFLFERCSDPNHLLLDLDHARRLGAAPEGYCVAPFEDEETLVGIVCEKLLSFSFATAFALGRFEKAVKDKGLAKLTRKNFRIGSKEVSLELATRWARWGAFGR